LKDKLPAEMDALAQFHGTFSIIIASECEIYNTKYFVRATKLLIRK